MESDARDRGEGFEPDRAHDPPPHQLRTLGAASLLRVVPGHEPAEILGPGKPFAVVVYLACAPGRTASRDSLIDLLWSNLDLEAARHGLRQTLWYLRKRLGTEAIRSRDHEVELLAPVQSDRDAFDDAVDRGDFQCAVELYRGEFLPMFASPGGVDFERWADMERFRLCTHFLEAAEFAVWELLEDGDYPKAKELATRVRDLHPMVQRSWRLLLEVLATGNDHVTARIEAEALERRLLEEGRSPNESIERLIEVIRESPAKRSVQPARSGLRPELIGREREFSAILAAWRAVATGRGRHVHIVGAPGLGKSRLLEEVDSRLRSMGATVVHHRAPPGRRNIPFGLASDLAVPLAALPGAEGITEGAARVLVGLNPTLTERFPVPPDKAGDAEALRRREAALAELLVAAASQGPLAILVDDLHWADALCRELVRSLCARVPDHPVLLVTTTRPLPEGGLEGPGIEELSLEPLSTEDIGALLASIGSLPDGESRWASELPERLCTATGGSPLLIVESLRLALERGWLTLLDGVWRCPDPRRLEAELPQGEALRRRILELGPEERRLLLILCVAGSPLSLWFLSQSAGMDTDEVSGHLHDLELRGLVVPDGDRWSPGHDEIGATVLDTVGEAELRRAHRAVGRCLANEAGPGARAGDADQLHRASRHLVAAGEDRELARVFDRWVRAVRRRGERRPVRVLASEMLGQSADTPRVRQLLRRVPLATRLGLNSSPSRRRMGVAVGAGAIAAALFLAFMPDRSPPDAVLMVLRPNPDGTVAGYQVPIRQDGWDRMDALDVARAGQPVPELGRIPAYGGHVLAGPSGSGWAYAAAVAEAWAPDLFLVAPGGTVERASRLPGDDVPMSWSPDGRQLVFQTGRWNPNFWQDLAILDLESRDVRPLVVREDASHSRAHWSPDGARIVFQRRLIARTLGELVDPGRITDMLCWITTEGSSESCVEPPFQEIDLKGWMDPRRVLAVASDGAGTRMLVAIDLDQEEVELVEADVSAAAVSPDGGWIAVRRGDRGDVVPGWYVHPTGRPEFAVPLEGVEDLPEWSIRWGHPEQGIPYLHRLEILAPDTLRVGVPSRLRARGYDSRGSPMPVHVLRWEVADTTVAAVDGTTGILRPEQVGATTVTVSAGGWRVASEEIVVREPSHQVVLFEDWAEGLEPRWVPFGNPPPTVTDWPSGGRAFWNRGDGVYVSGVYSREEFQSPEGLGMEAMLSGRITAPRAQRHSLGFHAWTHPESAARWDHETGGLPAGTSRCHFSYPAGDGFQFAALAHAQGRRVPVDPLVRTGAPYVVRLQVFPDGTCAVALNGVPLARADLRTTDDAPDRVVLGGASLDTEMLTGRVEVWEGIRSDVDWSVLEWDADAVAWQSARDARSKP